MKIDLNCDMGESFGSYKLGEDEAVMPFITSANIACGFHASDPTIMQSTIRLAKKYNLAIGAHPSWPDLQGFGRREMNLSAEETKAIVLYQIGALPHLRRLKVRNSGTSNRTARFITKPPRIFCSPRPLPAP